jgi:HEAT repeat protein
MVPAKETGLFDVTTSTLDAKKIDKHFTKQCPGEQVLYGQMIQDSIQSTIQRVAQRCSELAEMHRIQRLQRLERLLQDLSAEPDEGLTKRMKDDNPDIRMLAAQLIGYKRLHRETELIERLNDRDVEVRQAARQALVRLARGTDFGPVHGASKADRLRAMEKWRTWLSLQDGSSPETVLKPSLLLDKSGNGPDPRLILKLTDQDQTTEATLTTEDAEVAKLSSELLKAPDSQFEEVLERLRETKGVLHSEALALAIPQLTGDKQKQAREALVERMARMTAKTLRDKFQDDDTEIRRAASLACVRKAAKEHIPDLLTLLEDPEPLVVQAARSALKDLTGQDFGPNEDEPRSEQILSVAAWRGWWLKQAKDKK